MSTLKISEQIIQRADGSFLERALLANATWQEDYNASYHRKQPGLIGPVLTFGGLLMLVTTSQVDKAEMKSWPLGGGTVPLAVLALIVGVIMVVRRIQKSRKIPHIVISVPSEDAQTPLLRTNDKGWAEKIVQKLKGISEPSTGNWIIDSGDKSIIQE